MAFLRVTWRSSSLFCHLVPNLVCRTKNASWVVCLRETYIFVFFISLRRILSEELAETDEQVIFLSFTSENFVCLGIQYQFAYFVCVCV